MTLTFIDTGVLIAAARGDSELAAKAMAILDDPEREFVSSDFVKLEVLPKAVYHQNQAEVKFYELFFKSVKRWVKVSEALVEAAHAEACQTGLAAMDALHIVAATMTKADEFITTEKVGKPIHRATVVKVIPI